MDSRVLPSVLVMRCVYLASPLLVCALLCACSSPAFSTVPEEDVGMVDDGIVADAAVEADSVVEASVEASDGDAGDEVWGPLAASGAGFPVLAKGTSRDYAIAAYPDVKTVGDFFQGVFPTPGSTFVKVGHFTGEWHVDNRLVDAPGCLVRFVVRLIGYDIGIFDVTAKTGSVVRFKLSFLPFEIPTGFYLRYEVVSVLPACGSIRELSDPTSSFSIYAP